MVPVLVQRGRADCAQLAARQRRLHHVRRVDGALSATGAHDRVDLVDEQDDLALRVRDLVQDSLEPLLELATELCASQQRAQRTLLVLGIAAVIGIFVILFQAFGSATESLIVMTNLPLALIGGVAAVFLLSREMSIPSIIGFISLFGIATRNGIMLVTHYRHLKTAEGLPFEEAILKGSSDRLIPILMTAATAALGLFPLVVGAETGKEIERPLAIVILGGLFTSTFLNMIVVPSLFRRFARKAFEATESEHATRSVFSDPVSETNL